MIEAYAPYSSIILKNEIKASMMKKNGLSRKTFKALEDFSRKELE